MVIQLNAGRPENTKMINSVKRSIREGIHTGYYPDNKLAVKDLIFVVEQKLKVLCKADKGILWNKNSHFTENYRIYWNLLFCRRGKEPNSPGTMECSCLMRSGVTPDSVHTLSTNRVTKHMTDAPISMPSSKPDSLSYESDSFTLQSVKNMQKMILRVVHIICE